MIANKYKCLDCGILFNNNNVPHNCNGNFRKNKFNFEKINIIEMDNNPLSAQIGGNHYKEMKIQPIEFAMANKLNACQANILKYICRYKVKNGKEDLDKAKHYIDLLIKLEYSNVENK